MASREHQLQDAALINSLRDQILRERDAHEKRLRELRDIESKKAGIPPDVVTARLQEQQEKYEAKVVEMKAEAEKAMQEAKKSFEKDLQKLREENNSLRQTHQRECTAHLETKRQLAKQEEQIEHLRAAVAEEKRKNQTTSAAAAPPPVVVANNGGLTARTRSNIDEMEEMMNRLVSRLKEKEAEIAMLQGIVKKECEERTQLLIIIEQMKRGAPPSSAASSSSSSTTPTKSTTPSVSFKDKRR